MIKAQTWILLTILIVSVLPAAQAEDLKTYIWKDADGRVHYGDQPPPTEPFLEKTIRVDANARTARPKTGPDFREDMEDDDSNDPDAGIAGSRPLSEEDLAAIAHGQVLADDEEETLEQTTENRAEFETGVEPDYSSESNMRDDPEPVAGGETDSSWDTGSVSGATRPNDD